MESKLFSILSLLIHSQNGITAKEIAEKLDISVRTVMRYMNVLSNCKEKSFQIDSSKTNGYSLLIINNEQFEKYISLQRQEIFINEKNIKLILYIGLRKTVSINELANEFNYSISSIIRMIQQFNDILEDRLIYIEKSKDNLRLTGNEVKIRNYLTLSIANFYEYAQEVFLQWDIYYEHIKKILLDNGIEYKTNNNLIYLTITIIRYINGNIINLTEIIRLIYRNDSPSFKIINNLNKNIKEFFNIEFNNDECTFLQILLLKPDTEILDYNEISDYLKPIIEDSIKNIDEKYNTLFSNNVELVESLNYHVSNCFEDYILMTENDNDLLEQIKINFTNEYCYAIEFKKWIYQVLNVEIGDKDVGYIALHFVNCSQIKDIEYTINAQIVYKNNKAVATLLKSRIENKCQNINIEQIIKTDKLPNNLHCYDINFVFEDNFEGEVGVCKISPFLNYEDLKIINDEELKIRGKDSLIKMLFEDIFFKDVDFDNKKTLLDFLLNNLMNKNYLVEKECEQLLEREKLTSTEIVLDVAFPHVIVKGKSFISFSILKKPIFWKNNYVKIVILMGISNNDNNTRNSIQFLFNRLSNNELVLKIEKCNRFKDLVDIIEGE